MTTTRRDFARGTWSVWAGPSVDALTFIGGYRGVVDALTEADAWKTEHGNTVVVTDCDVIDEDGTPILDESDSVTVRLRWN